MNKVFLVLLCLACLNGFSQKKDESDKKKDPEKKKSEESKDKKEEKDKDKKETAKAGIWNLPRELSEISGIAFIGEEKVVCVQDEIGVLYIYDLKKESIVKQVKFAANGDFEGLTVIKDDAYVLQSDGKVYHIENFNEINPAISQINSPLNAQHNAEGLCYDEKNNRLLIAIKGIDPLLLDQKPVYALDLSKKSISAVPVFSIDLKDPLLGDVNARSFYQKLQISEILVIGDGLYLITDAVNGYVYSVNSKGELKTKAKVDRKDYPQPEGMCFYNNSEILISNEGKNGKAFLVKSKLSDWLKK